jgi:hypothetical protein
MRRTRPPCSLFFFVLPLIVRFLCGSCLMKQNIWLVLLRTTCTLFTALKPALEPRQSCVYERELISLWLYKENEKLRDWKNVFIPHIPPLSSTHLWLRSFNFFDTSKKNSLVVLQTSRRWNRKSRRLISTPRYWVLWCLYPAVKRPGCDMNYHVLSPVMFNSVKLTEVSSF